MVNNSKELAKLLGISKMYMARTLNGSLIGCSKQREEAFERGVNSPYCFNITEEYPDFERSENFVKLLEIIAISGFKFTISEYKNPPSGTYPFPLTFEEQEKMTWVQRMIASIFYFMKSYEDDGWIHLEEVRKQSRKIDWDYER